ncbi:MAG: NADH dehydrogenase [Candidatus Firestonebacteria bacterium RIFOXYC2_FULL_39_67]|nr:MAG: NADH dehydrogenase [Candidatus Firestonebacteria bacterium RIFOXYD2_FULL_39_29]OGF54296.1 MAG: NADH dehydrogenase [Candidatus Firestonebacteria bacterium RIFOXYC2_FULL_39_67]
MEKKIIYLRDTDSAEQERINDFFTLFSNELRDANLSEPVQLVKIADIGLYEKGIVVKILPENIIYTGIKNTDVKRIVEESIKDNKIIKDLLYEKKSKQLRAVLKNCGYIDPESIEDYIDAGGYKALVKVLTGMKPENVIDELKKSGLRGRGGAGYPTWMKWNFARGMNSPEKYVICNGDEGDPGAYMDRSVLEGDPHSVLEGMIIAGYAIGSLKGYFYIRAEYPLAVERVQKAIDQAVAAGLLGNNILGSIFNFELEIRLGAGAFVCGEETALIASIEGKRGTPHPRPPYPSVKGLWEKPTIINNVETLANIPQLIAGGGAKFASIGTEKSKGTKVFALTGKVKNSGLVEVPMGITLREIIFDIGGGILNNRAIKAVQTGGPSGGVIPKEYLDTPVDYENLGKLGSIMGSGGMIAIDDTDCLVDLAKFYLKFCVDESCGKCAPCRLGGYQLLCILEKISEGKGELEDLNKLKKISYAMQKASLCGLGQSASNPVFSTIRYFEEEYRQHIVNKKCPAGKCKALVYFKILPQKCKKCGLCMKNCPSNAILGSREAGYVIDPQKCIKCGACFDVCKFKAVLKE